MFLSQTCRDGKSVEHYNADPNFTVFLRCIRLMKRWSLIWSQCFFCKKTEENTSKNVHSIIDYSTFAWSQVNQIKVCLRTDNRCHLLVCVSASQRWKCGVYALADSLNRITPGITSHTLIWGNAKFVLRTQRPRNLATLALVMYILKGEIPYILMSV